jgi:hypothetical protein
MVDQVKPTYRLFPQASAMDTFTPPPTLSSQPSPTATSARASRVEKRISIRLETGCVVEVAEEVDEEGAYERESELLPNVISGRGRLSDFSALCPADYQLFSQCVISIPAI